MTRTLTKTEASDVVSYQGGGLEITVYKTNNGDLHYSILVTNSEDVVYRPWADLCAEIEGENTIL